MTTKNPKVKFPCLEVQQGKFTLVCFVAKARTLWELVKINKREADKDVGYQRTLSPSRVSAITRYIDKGNSIPNTILLALDSAAEVREGAIYIPNRDDAGWVIDGQHRLAGAKEAQSDIELAVIALIDTPIEEQVRQFVVINREGKGVPTSLYYDLLKYMPPTKSETDVAKEKAAEIGNALKKDEDSPFFGRVVISSPKRGELSLNNFVRKTYPLLKDKTGKFHTYTQMEQAGIINNYFKAMRHVFPEQFEFARSTFLKTLGFGAMINALPTVFDLSLKHYSGFTVEEAIKILKAVDYFDFSAWEQLGTGNEAETRAGEDFRLDLTRALDNEGQPGVLRL